MRSLGNFPDPFIAGILGQLDAVRRAADGLAGQRDAYADVMLDTGAGPEQGPSTMTFAASLVTLAAVAGAIAPGVAARVRAWRLPRHFHAGIEGHDA